MKFEKQVSLKWAIALVLIACLVSSSIVYYVFAVSPSSAFTISSGVYPGAPCYTVWREGDYYFAKDANGEIDYSGTDASQIIQSALDHGKSVFVKKGLYIITASLQLNTLNYLFGEGWDTEFRKGANIDVITLKSSAVYNVHLENFYINGYCEWKDFPLITLGNYTGSGIVLNNTGFPDEPPWTPYSGADTAHRISNVIIRYCKSYGVRLLGNQREILATSVRTLDNGDIGFSIEGGGDGKYVSCISGSNGNQGFLINGSTNQFINCKAFGNGQNNVTGKADGFSIGRWNNQFINCYSQGNGRDGFLIWQSLAYNNLIEGAIIDSNNVLNDVNGAGVCIDHAHDNIVVGCQFVDSQSPKLMRGMNLFASDNNTVSFNNFRMVKTPVFSFDTSHDKITQNVGFVTENSGTANIITTSTVTFDHGLAGTPTHVECGFKTIGYGTWKWSATSTQITITVENSGTYTFSWYAEYKP